jgi:hypothetical protein
MSRSRHRKGQPKKVYHGISCANDARRCRITSHIRPRGQVETLFRRGSVARRQPFSNHDPKHKQPTSQDCRSQASRRPRQPGRLSL